MKKKEHELLAVDLQPLMDKKWNAKIYSAKKGKIKIDFHW